MAPANQKKKMSQQKMTGGKTNGKTELIGKVKLERIKVLLPNKIGGNTKPSVNWLDIIVQYNN